MYQHTVTIQIRDNAQHPWTSAPSITVTSEGPVTRAPRRQQPSNEPSHRQLHLPPPMRPTRYRCSICDGDAPPDSYQTWFQASYLPGHPTEAGWAYDTEEETHHPIIGRLLTESVIVRFYVTEAEVTRAHRGCDLAAFYVDGQPVYVDHQPIDGPQTPYRDLWIHICSSCLAGLRDSVYPISQCARTALFNTCSRHSAAYPCSQECAQLNERFKNLAEGKTILRAKIQMSDWVYDYNSHIIFHAISDVMEGPR